MRVDIDQALQQIGARAMARKGKSADVRQLEAIEGIYDELSNLRVILAYQAGVKAR